MVDDPAGVAQRLQERSAMHGQRESGTEQNGGGYSDHHGTQTYDAGIKRLS